MKKSALFIALACCALPVPALAQMDDPRTIANPNRPVPDRLMLNRLLWSTMTAIHNANRSGNYSVLRDLGATNFQIQFSAAQLAGIFQNIREQQIDLSNTLLLAPEFLSEPAIVSENVMRVQGVYGLRPIAIEFDLYYQWQAAEWRLVGVDIQPRELVSVQPAE